jgi:primosomal protein N' (replication factor Y)
LPPPTPFGAGVAAAAIVEGSIISIPLRGKEAYGLVLTCVSVSDLRQNIRTSSFALRKLTNPKPHLTLSRTFLRALFDASMTLACPPGALIYAYTSSALLASRTQMPETIPLEEKRPVGYEPLLYSATHAERISEYKRLAREALARGVSMLIITPTIIEAERIGETLTSGIQEYVETLHSALSKKKLLERWQRALVSKHALVIVGTPMALSLARDDIATIILEREGSTSYNREERPYASGKVVAEAYARYLGARFILASTTPSVESAYRKMTGELQDVGLSLVRLPGPTPLHIDLREHKKERGGYDPLTPTLVEKLVPFVQEKKQILLIAARRGLAPLTCCDDCGTTLVCTRCKTALVLHEHNSNRKFLCHHCGQEESASIRCSKCGGWRLTTLGIALDGVTQSVEKHFPNTPRISVGSDSRQTEVKAVATWHEKGGILLATERIIPYLPEEIPMVAIASVDSFLSIPEYTASERAFTLLVELRSRASELFLVQTRDPAHRVMRALREGTGNAFYKEELADRERFGYPPYATLIRFTSSGKKEMVEKEIESIAKALAHMAPIRMEGKATSRAHVRMHILLRLPQGSWIDQRLLRFIRTLPPTIEIRINPTSLHSN